MTKQTQGHIKQDGKGNHQLAFAHQETDYPVLPVAQLEQLNGFKPSAVDWVIQQTQTEGEHRRKEARRVNTFIFVERVLGQIFALLMGVAGVSGGSWVAYNGHDWAGTVIAGAAITGLAVAYLKGRAGTNSK